MSKRKIKFRGKTTHEIDQKWIYGSLLDEEEKDMPMIWHLGIWRPVYEESVGQYTGLKDKGGHGKEVYEGDILRFAVFDHNGADTQYQGVVVYSGSRFMLWNSPDEEYYGSDGGFDLDVVLAQDSDAEVIGNKFENPELLEQ